LKCRVTSEVVCRIAKESRKDNSYRVPIQFIDKGQPHFVIKHPKCITNQPTFYSNIHPTRCNITQFILSGNCSTCFGWYHHPSSEAQTTVSTTSGICHTIITICRYRGRVGTGLSVLWVAAHSNRFQLFHDSGR